MFLPTCQPAPVALLQYRTRADLRTPVFVLPRVLDKLALALFIGTLYW